MSNLEIELQALKGNLLEMMNLAVNQIKKCKSIFIDRNVEIAEEVITIENRINFLELSLSKDCENILALYNPVATDLRFVLAVLRINNDLERIGDNAKSLSKFAINYIDETMPLFIKKFEMEAMFDAAIAMLSEVGEALQKDDAQLARSVFRKDDILNQINYNAPIVASELIQTYPDQAKIIVRLLSLISKMERVGDLTVNVAEEVVFHVEARVLKHSKHD